MPQEKEEKAVPAQEPEEKIKVKGKKDDKKKADDELSAEDQKLKDTLDLLVQTITEDAASENHEAVQHTALEALRTEIRSSTSSMTSIPKPLKFLTPKYPTMKEYNLTMAEGPNKVFMNDIMSVMAMTMAEAGSRESLKYKLKGTVTDLSSWGHEYVRHICGEIAEAWHERVESDQATDDLVSLVNQILPFKLQHKREFEAVDLLIDVDLIGRVIEIITSDNCHSVCKYILACAQYLGDPDEHASLLTVVYTAHMKFKNYADALRVAINLERKDLMISIFETVQDCKMEDLEDDDSDSDSDSDSDDDEDKEKPASSAMDETKDRNPDPDCDLIRKQLCYILAAQNIVLEELESQEELMEIMGNVHLNKHFLSLASELDVKESKRPEDIYKTHLVEGHGRKGRSEKKTAGPTHDSAKKNLADTFVNAFLNCGFGSDSLVTPEGSDWIFKNRGHGKMSAAASMGLIMLWDVETGFNAVDIYSFSPQSEVKAGGLLATGILSANITSDMDVALGLLTEHIEEGKDNLMKVSAVLGLGFAYAGSARADVLELLVPLIVDDSQPFEVVAITCLALGYVFVGTANLDVSESITESFLDRSDEDLNDPLARLMCLGMGLLFLGQGEKVEGAMGAIAAITNQNINKYLKMTMRTCAFAGSGSVLEIQRLLNEIGEHIEEDEKDPQKGMHQEVAVLGIAMIAMGEEVSSAMAYRSLDHILQYGELNVRRAVSLALGLLSISNPQMSVIDTLSKLSHDQDERLSQNAVLSLGLVGAGTNNSRIAGILRNLAAYYEKEPNHLFLVRIAQGILHMGKGLMTLDPFHSQHTLLSKVATAGMLTLLHGAFDTKKTILADRHYLLYSLCLAARPRMLITLNGDNEAVPVSVRVGQAVDTVGQAGNPRTITGFQTHTTPVLIAANERAELGNDEYLPFTSVLEGFVVVKPNPDATKEDL